MSWESITRQEETVERGIVRLSDSLNGNTSGVSKAISDVKYQLFRLEDSISSVDSHDEEAIQSLESHKEKLRHFKALLRKTVIQLRHQMDLQVKLDRENLLAFEHKERKSMDEPTSRSQQFSQGLQRTKTLLMNELDRSDLALQTLNKSTAVLEAARDEMVTYSGVLNKGKGLITSLLTRARSDKFILYFGVAFYLLVVFFIVFKRVGYLLSFFSFLWSWLPG